MLEITNTSSKNNFRSQGVTSFGTIYKGVI